MIRIGSPPYLECSTRGDRRFSAFCARIKGRENKSIEEIYQGAKVFSDGTTGLNWKTAKGRKPINIEDISKLYSLLWDEYIEENPELMDMISNASGFSDMFGQPGHQCQAIEIWRIKKKNE